MIATAQTDAGKIVARTLTALHSNVIPPRCEKCDNTAGFRNEYCTGCAYVAGNHFHRDCVRCGHRWFERSAWHLAVLDVTPGDPRFPLICQHCGKRDASDPAARRGCCATPELNYHDTTEPCDACRRYAA